MKARVWLGAWLLTACGAWAQAPGPAVTLRDAAANGHRLTEVSGLAWDDAAQRLYAVSDRGLLYHLALERSSAQPLAVHLLNAHPLKDPHGARVDAEGLSLLAATESPSGQTELLVASEGPARVLRYSTEGVLLGEWALPPALAGSRAMRRGNSQLEAVAHHPRQGLLVAAEAPGLDGGRKVHVVHSATREWRFAAGSGRQVRLKAMDVLPDGRLLVLERAQASGGGWINRLLEVDLAACGGATTCAATERLRLDAEDGEDGAANHEGMTMLDATTGAVGAVGPVQVLLVSDDRGARQRGTRFQLLALP